MKETSRHTFSLFNILCICFCFSFLTKGLGNYLFGMEFFTDFTTLFIYIAFFVLLFANKLRFPSLIFYVTIFIILQTFVLNIRYIDFKSSLMHFIGLILFMVVIFNFISLYRYQLKRIVHLYFGLCYWICVFALFQTLVFVSTGISIIPQNIIAGKPVYGTDYFVPEIFDILPRIVGLSTEPAHFTMFLMPALYVSILRLAGGGVELGRYSKKKSMLILITFILSFSIVGYLGMFIALLFIFRKQLRKNKIAAGLIFMLFVGVSFGLMQTTIGSKITSMLTMSQDITGSEYTSNDQTSFALLSNLVVAGKGLEISRYLGTGLNSHVITYNATINSLFFDSQITNQLNKENGGSLFIRLPSELGIPGLLAYLFFLVRFYAGARFGQSWAKIINHMTLVCLLAYSIRDGHYLDIHFVFFLAVFFYSYKIAKEFQLSSGSVVKSI